jgi:hypothetical protein
MGPTPGVETPIIPVELDVLDGGDVVVVFCPQENYALRNSRYLSRGEQSG